MLRKLCENVEGMIDLGVILMIGIAFAGMLVMGLVMWIVVSELNDLLDSPSTPNGSFLTTQSNNTLINVTGGFDSAVNLILVAMTIFILAIAISALLLLRQR